MKGFAWMGLLTVTTSGCVIVEDGSDDTGVTTEAGSPVDTDTVDTTAALPAGFRALVDGVVFLPPVCDPAAAEECNARDDDCSGRIDDGCGVPGGAGIQVVLGQIIEADFALSVESPIGGHRLNSGTNDVEYGGRFEKPREESCVFAAPSDYVQGAFWEAPLAPTGTYRVDFSVYSDCGLFPGDVDVEAEVGVVIGEVFVGTFRFPYHRDEFASTTVVPVLEFDVQ